MPIADLAVHEPDYRTLIAFLKAMEFSTLTRRVGGIRPSIDAGAIEPDPAGLAVRAITQSRRRRPRAGVSGRATLELGGNVHAPHGGSRASTAKRWHAAAARRTPRSKRCAQRKVDRSKYETMRSA